MPQGVINTFKWLHQTGLWLSANDIHTEVLVLSPASDFIEVWKRNRGCSHLSTPPLCAPFHPAACQWSLGGAEKKEEEKKTANVTVFVHYFIYLRKKCYPFQCRGGSRAYTGYIYSGSDPVHDRTPCTHTTLIHTWSNLGLSICLPACFWTVGENQNTLRKHGREHAKTPKLRTERKSQSL